MKTYLENTQNNTFWEITYVADEEMLLIRSGEIGFEGKVEEIDYEQAFEKYNAPPEWAFEVAVAEKIKEGFVKVINPTDLLQQIELAHGVALQGRIRSFYESGKVLTYQNKFHSELKCFVNFDSRYAKTASEQSYDEDLIPIAGKINAKGYEDEQIWIGINPDEAETAVYELYTSDEYDVLYDSFGVFLSKFELG